MTDRDGSPRTRPDSKEKNGGTKRCRRCEVENPDRNPSPSGRNTNLGGSRDRIIVWNRLRLSRPAMRHSLMQLLMRCGPMDHTRRSRINANGLPILVAASGAASRQKDGPLAGASLSDRGRVRHAPARYGDGGAGKRAGGPEPRNAAPAGARLQARGTECVQLDKAANSESEKAQ